jgi:hypothetical protein
MSKALLISYDVTPSGFKPAFINQPFREFYSVAHEGLEGLPPTLKPENISEVLARCIENDFPTISIEPLLTPQNGAKAVRWVHVPVKDNKGKVIEVLAIGTPLP